MYFIPKRYIVGKFGVSRNPEAVFACDHCCESTMNIKLHVLKRNNGKHLRKIDKYSDQRFTGPLLSSVCKSNPCNFYIMTSRNIKKHFSFDLLPKLNSTAQILHSFLDGTFWIFSCVVKSLISF